MPELALNAWYLDDGTLLGRVEQLRQVMDILVDEGPARGLILSTAATVTAPAPPKTTIWSPADMGGEVDPLDRGITKVNEEGVILLGAPLGTEAFVAREVKRKVEKVREISDLLPQLEDPHTEFCLLRSCLALPKLSFLTRAVDTSSHVNHLQEFDRVTKEGLTRILGAPVGHRTWQQAKLPVSLGGLGLRAAEDHAPIAHAASVLSLQPLRRTMLGTQGVDQQPQGDAEAEPLPDHPGSDLSRGLLTALSRAQGEEAVEEALVGMTQKQMAYRVDQHQKQLLMDDVGEDEVRERARLSSLGLPHAGDWLNTPPLAALGLHLRAAEFVPALKYRLGLPVFTSEGPCPACLRFSDALGDHALCCGTGGERISRHNNLRDALFDTAVAAGLGPVKEGRFLLPGSDRRPADVRLPN